MFKRMIMYFISAFAGIAAAVLLSGVFAVATVTGNGMEPALDEGSTVVINKLAYEDNIPKVGNIIALKNNIYGEDGEGSVLIRRVAGSAEDTVEIKDNIFYLNGKPYFEHMNEAVNMEDMKKVKLKDNQLFVLSDDRKASLDSRDKAVGIVNMSECIGKVCFR